MDDLWVAPCQETSIFQRHPGAWYRAIRLPVLHASDGGAGGER